MQRNGPEPGAGAAIAAGFLALSLLAASCSIEYQTAAPEGEKPPTARFSGYAHTVVVRGEKAFELKAESAAVYASENRTLLTGVSFTEYDSDTGEVISRGEAELATFHDDTEDAEFSGSVRLESKRQDAALSGEYLSWNATTKRLEGRLDRTVTLSRQDGSSVSGAGFSADARRRSFSFRESVEGFIVAEDAPPAPPAAEASAPPAAEASAPPPVEASVPSAAEASAPPSVETSAPSAAEAAASAPPATAVPVPPPGASGQGAAP